MIHFQKLSYLLLLSFSLAIVSCAQKNVGQVIEIPQAKSTDDSSLIMSFDQRMIDLGIIKKGEKREIEYTFTNISDEDIKISQVSTCECTEVLKRPYLPVKPGAKGVIKVLFDSNKKDEEEPLEIDIWLEKEDPNTGMPVLERVGYKFKYKS